MSGSETIRFTNTATRAVEDLRLHLYLNAFKNDQTLFLRSPFGAGRSAAFARDWGYVDVRSLRVREHDNQDLWPRAEAHSPGDPQDQTDIRVPLPIPLASGQTLTLDLEFEAKLPEIVERTGYSGSFHLAGQWYPKLARLEPDGRWAHFAFHPQAEFYGDFGNYSVEIDVATNYTVGATGKLVAEHQDGDRHRVEYRAERVHDFAWTAWDAFEERRDRIDDVDVRLLFPHDHRLNAARTLDALHAALPFFNRTLGHYPYPALTVVHPPEHARRAGGMEYPTLITTGGPWYASYFVRSVEAVTIHELAHQWFYGLVATNEARWPLLDEGLASYVESVALERHYGRGSLVDSPTGLRLSVAEALRYYALEYGGDQAPATAARDFATLQGLGGSVYARTATVLRTLAGAYSESAVLEALSEYVRDHRFRHPSPEAWELTLRSHLGKEAATLWHAAVHDRAFVDYRVHSLRQTHPNEPAGVFDTDAGREVRQRPAPDLQQWVAQAVVVRDGTLRVPVEIRLVREDGVVERRWWNGDGDVLTVEYAGESPLQAVTVDPTHRVALDENRFNNAVVTSPSRAWRVRERSSYFAALLLRWLLP